MLNSMSYNFTLQAVHIPGKRNIKADLLSRFQISEFKRLFPEVDKVHTYIPEDIRNCLK